MLEARTPKCFVKLERIILPFSTSQTEKSSVVLSSQPALAKHLFEHSGLEKRQSPRDQIIQTQRKDISECGDETFYSDVAFQQKDQKFDMESVSARKLVQCPECPKKLSKHGLKKHSTVPILGIRGSFLCFCVCQCFGASPLA